MLTKQERNDIAKRAVDLDFTEDDSVYKVLIGKEIPDCGARVVRDEA